MRSFQEFKVEISGLGFEAALSLGTSVPFHYMTYIIRTCPIVEGQLLALR